VLVDTRMNAPLPPFIGGSRKRRRLFCYPHICGR